MHAPEKPFPKLREIRFGRVKKDPTTIVLTARDSEDGEYHAGITPKDAGHMIADMIASLGQNLDVDRMRSEKVELSAVKVVVANAGIGFGDSAKGPVVVAQIGGLTLVFTISAGDLIEMAHEIIDNFDDAGGNNSAATSH